VKALPYKTKGEHREMFVLALVSLAEGLVNVLSLGRVAPAWRIVHLKVGCEKLPDPKLEVFGEGLVGIADGLVTFLSAGRLTTDWRAYYYFRND
jgi:hypothetical protein